MNKKTPQNSQPALPLNKISARKEREKTDQETAQIMSKILNIPLSRILAAMDLFSEIDPQMKICFYKLYKLEKRHYVTAFMLLEYLLSFEKGAMEIIGE